MGLCATPFLSIVIPCHNAGAKISRAIESCLRLRDFSFEIIVVDDASTDDTQTKLSSYVDDRRLNVTKFEGNQGASSARNFGVSIARGEFIIFLDADDYFLENASRDFYAAIEENPHLDLYCFGYMINGKKSPKPDSSALHLEFIRKKFSNTNTFLVRRKALNGHSFEKKYRVGEDTLFWFKLLLERPSGYFEKYVAYYDYIPKLNLVDRHPILDLDLENMGVSQKDAKEIRNAVTRNTDMKKAFGRADPIRISFQKLGVRGLVYWLLGPGLFRPVWNLKHKLKS
jgi:glycosyltransferase involved in cell wall biosynthesis